MLSIHDPKGVFRRRFSTNRPQNYLFHETIAKLTQSAGFESEIWLPLTTARLQIESACPYEAACGILHVACIPITDFFDHTLPGDVNKTLNRFEKRIDTFQSALNDFRTERRWDLQEKADHHTDFGRTGHLIDPDALMQRMLEDLATLKWIMSLPSPPPSHIQPKKPNDKRAAATARARLLKREISNLYVMKNHRIIAAIINALEDLDPPYTDENVSKA